MEKEDHSIKRLELKSHQTKCFQDHVNSISYYYGSYNTSPMGTGKSFITMYIGLFYNYFLTLYFYNSLYMFLNNIFIIYIR